MAGRWSKKKKAGTDVWFGRAAEDLPYKKISPLSSDLFASYSGPDKGLVVVDELENGNNAVQNGTTPNSPSKKDDIAGAARWNFKNRKAYGICMSLYDQHPINGRISGDPIADSFAICARKNCALLVVADGVNWGEKSKIAARCAVYGCVKFMNERLFPGQKSGLRNTHDATNLLLKSLDVAHESIITHEGGLTTLCAALILPAKDTKQFAVCIVNVGDSLGYVFSKRHGIREITTGSHDIQSERDIRDAGGALGPVNGKDPELHNLTCSMTYVDRGDIVYLTTDGISDNFDPVVTKIAVAKKNPVPAKDGNENNADTITTTECGVKDGKPEMEPHERHQYATKEMERVIHEFELFTEMPVSAQELCGALLQHVLKLTDSKRKVLENPDLYGKKLKSKDRKRRDSEIVAKMSRAPGKLDHATIVGYEVGKYHGNEDEDYEALDSDAESSICGSYLTTEDSDYGRSRDDLDDMPTFVLPSEDYDVVSPISEDTFKNLRDNPDEATDDEIEDPFEYIDTEQEVDDEDENEDVKQVEEVPPPGETIETDLKQEQTQKLTTWPPKAAKRSPKKRPEPKRDRAMGLLLHLQPNLSYPVMNHAAIGQREDLMKKFGVKRRKKPKVEDKKKEVPLTNAEEDEASAGEGTAEDVSEAETKDKLALENEIDMEITPEGETEPNDAEKVDKPVDEEEIPKLDEVVQETDAPKENDAEVVNDNVILENGVPTEDAQPDEAKGTDQLESDAVKAEEQDVKEELQPHEEKATDLPESDAVKAEEQDIKDSPEEVSKPSAEVSQSEDKSVGEGGEETVQIKDNDISVSEEQAAVQGSGDTSDTNEDVPVEAEITCEPNQDKPDSDVADEPEPVCSITITAAQDVISDSEEKTEEETVVNAETSVEEPQNGHPEITTTEEESSDQPGEEPEKRGEESAIEDPEVDPLEGGATRGNIMAQQSKSLVALDTVTALEERTSGDHQKRVNTRHNSL